MDSTCVEVQLMPFADMMDGLAGACVRTLGESEPVVYLRGAIWARLGGIYEATHLALDPETGGEISVDQPTLFIRSSDLPFPPLAGDLVKLRGATYRVADPQYDGNAGYVLMLQR